MDEVPGVCAISNIHCLLDLSCGECNVISLYFLCCSVNGSVCLLGVVVILLLNIMEVLSVGGG